jgi:hypothetical protein
MIKLIRIVCDHAKFGHVETFGVITGECSNYPKFLRLDENGKGVYGPDDWYVEFFDGAYRYMKQIQDGFGNAKITFVDVPDGNYKIFREA